MHSGCLRTLTCIHEGKRPERIECIERVLNVNPGDVNLAKGQRFSLPSERDVVNNKMLPYVQKDWMELVVLAAKGNEYSGEDTGSYDIRFCLLR